MSAAAWLAAANPFHKPASRDEAARAARWSCVALVIGGVMQIVSAAWMWLNRDRLLAAMREYMDGMVSVGADPELESMRVMQDAMIVNMPMQQLVMAAVVMAFLIVMAVIQWKKPNPIIPGIWLALAVYGLFSLGLVLVMAPMMETMFVRIAEASGEAFPQPPSMETLGTPLWLMALLALKNLLAVILHIAGLRGGLSIKRFPT